jgi:hypothetical protein
MFFGAGLLDLSILGDMGEDNVGDEGPLVDTVSGLLNIPIGFLPVSTVMSSSVVSTRSTSKLVVMIGESMEVFFSILIDEGYVNFSCIFLHADDRCPFNLHIKQVTVSSVRNIRKLVLLRLITIDGGILS